jgi:hypothetical protein
MNAIDVLRYGQLTLLGTLEGLPADARDQPGACGIWSVKDIFAHLASYELVLVDVLRSAAAEGSDTPRLDRFVSLREAFNDTEVADRMPMGFEDVLAELADAHAETLRLVAGIPAERLREPGTLPWYGADYAIDDLIVYQYYGHKREHGAQVEAFRDHGARLARTAGSC